MDPRKIHKIASKKSSSAKHGETDQHSTRKLSRTTAFNLKKITEILQRENICQNGHKKIRAFAMFLGIFGHTGKSPKTQRQSLQQQNTDVAGHVNYKCSKKQGRMIQEALTMLKRKDSNQMKKSYFLLKQSKGS